MYHGYYRLTDDELVDLWENCIFAVDANVMLRMFRYTEGKETLIKVFKSIKDRLFIPHQASMEYHEKLKEKIVEQRLEYNKVADEINKNFNDLKIILSTKRLNLALDTFDSDIDDIKSKIIRHIDEKRSTHPDLEKFSTELATLFSGNVGEPYSQEKLNEIYTLGETRYSMRVPPGFGDIKEKEKRPPRSIDGLIYTDLYGDLVMWNQLIEKANSTEPPRPLIFITEDLTKGDWIQLYKDTKIKIGVHPALRQEFAKRTNGCKFSVYSIEEFLQSSEKYLTDSNVNPIEMKKAIENVKEVDLINEVSSNINEQNKRIDLSHLTLRTRKQTSMQQLKKTLKTLILSQKDQLVKMKFFLEYSLIESDPEYSFNEKYQKLSTLQDQLLSEPEN
ncbi:PIN-like domain-containing protein [Cohnella phaseoli]|uniref:PIN-like domain-containing protein n=1 Tax=Cohnella phaseoli TaxID=456490 RepID=UPI001FE5F011|nr:PIN-like domain-containing protein [Cohnella phaseoli]